jgi:hypothetical protein
VRACLQEVIAALPAVLAALPSPAAGGAARAARPV